MLTCAECRAGRGLLDWSQEALAAQAGVSLDALRRFEAGGGVLSPQESEAVTAAFRGAGVALLSEQGEGIGVRLAGAPSAEEGLRPEELNASNDD